MNEQLIRYFSGELNQEERLEVIQRVESDGSLKEDFIRLQNIYAIFQLSPKADDRKEGKKSFEKFIFRVNHKTKKKNFINILKYVAVAAILITSSVIITLYLNNQSQDKSMNTLYVPAGQRAQITLQDGTEVWLNAQSTLKYPSRFSKKNREVEMIGEAFFDVEKDKKRPFIVSTQNIELQVLGTQFNVYSYPDAGYIQAALVEGSLRICEKQNEKKAILLAPNEQMTLKESKMSITPISNPDHLLWRKGIYSFNNERLINIIEKLELYYDITIKVEDPEIFNVRYTGKFRQSDGIDEILRILQIIQPFKIVRDRDNNIITLSK